MKRQFTIQSISKKYLITILALFCYMTGLFSSRTILLNESFEGDVFPPTGWTMIDADNDGKVWEHNLNYGNIGNRSTSSRSWEDFVELDPDNYLITPAITLPVGTLFIEYYVFISSYYPDTYSIMVSTTTPTIDAFVAVFTESHVDNSWVLRRVDISTYGGQTIYIAFRHHDSYNEDQVAIDDVKVYQMLPNDLAAISVQGSVYLSVGVSTTHSVTIRNEGLNTASNYTVLLKQGDNVLASTAGIPLESLQNHAFPLTWTPEVSGNTYIVGEVLWSVDEDLSNNQTPPFAITALSEGFDVSFIGNQTNFWWGGSIPMNVQAPSSVMQMICLDNELPAAGLLLEIRFIFSGSGNIQEPVPLRVFLAHTNRTNFEDNEFIPLNQMNEVFNGNISLNFQGINMVTIPIEPFSYVGGNLAIMVYNPMINGTPFWNDNWQQSSTGGNYRTLHVDSEQIIDINNLNQYNGAMTNVISNTALLFTTANSGSLSGTVTHNGNPIEGAKVSIEDTSINVYTNQNGQYTVPFISSGSINLKVVKVGFFDESAQNVLITEGQNTVQNFSLTPLPTYTVTGRIMSSDSNLPLNNVSVYITGYADFPIMFTNAQGQFSFQNVYISQDYILVANFDVYNELRHQFIVGNDNVNLGDIMIFETTYPVRFLYADEIDDFVKLTWLPPKPPNHEDNWFSHAGDELYRGIGTGNNDWIMAHRFTPEQLNGLGVAGANLSEVSFGLDSNSTVVNLDIQVYIGGSIDPLDPGTLVYVQAVNPLFLQYHVWNEIELTSPVPIPNNQEMWIAIRAAVQGYPFMSDELDMVHYYGNIMYSRGVWTTLYDQNPMLTYNWSIKGKAVSNGQTVNLSTISNRSFESYNVYRTTRENIDNPALWTTLATNHSSTEFVDHTVTDLSDLTFYRYIVRAAYTNDNLSAPVYSNQIVKKVKDMAYIGNPGSTTYSFSSPVNLAYQSSITQTLYQENEIGLRGVISDLMLTIRTDGNMSATRNYNLFVAHTNKEYFYNEDDWHPYSEFIHIWRGNLPLTDSGIYEIFIKLDTPIDYKGGNLIIMGYGEHDNFWTPYTHIQSSTGYQNIRMIYSENHNPIPHPQNSYPNFNNYAYAVANIGFFYSTVYNDTEIVNVYKETLLHGNYPNPFNPNTYIAFDKSKTGNVCIEIFNIRGQKVRVLVDHVFEAGTHKIMWDGKDDFDRNVSSGVYFYRMKTEEVTNVKRMLLLK